MTILGALVGHDYAMAWADSLVTVDHGPARHRCKLAVNPLAGVVGTACGWELLADAGDAAVLAAESLDEAVPAVVRALRRASAGAVPQMAPETRFGFYACAYTLTGWSTRIGRFVAYELAGSAFFEPLLTTCTARPRLHAPPPLRPLEPAEVAELAAHQAAALGAPVGRLTIATLTLGGMQLLPPTEIPPLPVPDNPASLGSVAAGVSGDAEAALCWGAGRPEHPLFVAA